MQQVFDHFCIGQVCVKAVGDASDMKLLSNWANGMSQYIDNTIYEPIC